MSGLDEKDCLDRLERGLDELRELNLLVPIIVEGEKDVEALRKLGLLGEIIAFNRGLSVVEFCDWYERQYQSVVLLTDWDRAGGRLCRLMLKHFKGRVDCDVSFRKICVRCTKTRVVEGLPSFMHSLRRSVGAAE